MVENILSGEVSISITISIVSHGHGGHIKKLLGDLQKFCGSDCEVILTKNISEDVIFNLSAYNYKLKVINNCLPRGFAANHNTAFTISSGRYFCVVNPDVRMPTDPFPSLISCLGECGVGVVGTLVRNSLGEVEENGRPFPTVLMLFMKMLGFNAGNYKSNNTVIYPDWLAGMFLVFKKEIYRKIQGFDESYFLYYEDVDICARLTLSGYRVVLCSGVSIVHDAQKDSHRKLKFMRWHLVSMIRFLMSSVNRRIKKS